MKCVVVPVTPYQQNCSVLLCEATGRVAVVDPGGDLEQIEAAINKLGGTLEKVLLTHGHMDHCAIADVIRRKYGVPIEGPHRADSFWIDKLPEWTRMMQFPHADPFVPDRWLEEGDKVTFGDEELLVKHCPGHTPGHVVFYQPTVKLAIVGDVLFKGSIGRTDFPQGDYDTLIDAIVHKLWPLGDDVTVLPGHGPTTTIGEERRSNPFVADSKFA